MKIVRLLLGGIISIIILGLSLPIIQDSKNIYTALKKESITTLLEELEHKKILFIGEDHIIINEELFLAENLQKFYDTGVRYIFVESNPDLDIFIPGSKNYYFLLFYPWIIAGWKYETQSLQQAILAFNAKLPEADRIKILSPEPYINSMDIYKDILNYRDSNGAETIINIMDKTDNTVKALIFYGSGHANIKIEKNYINELSNIKYDWMPLAYRLKKHYEDNFASYRFAYIPNNIKKYVSESSFILTENIHAVKIINAIRKNPRYDGFIVEREGISGSFYQYNPTDENLQFILNMVEDYALYNQNAVPDTAYMPFDAQDQFLMGLYYLKLYFSDKFDYDFWKIGVSTTLITALASLKEYAFRQGTPSRFINLAYDHDDMLLYHTYINNADIERYLTSKHITSPQEAYLIKAYELFPEDIWTLYWLGFIKTEKKQYAEALTFFKLLFENKLSTCMESLPLAYRKAALCAGELKNKELETEYTSMADNLSNEYNIDVSGYYFTGYLFNAP